VELRLNETKGRNYVKTGERHWARPLAPKEGDTPANLWTGRKKKNRAKRSRMPGETKGRRRRDAPREGNNGTERERMLIKEKKSLAHSKDHEKHIGDHETTKKRQQKNGVDEVSSPQKKSRMRGMKWSKHNRPRYKKCARNAGPPD